MTVQVQIDPALCNGYGNCVVVAPEVFDLDRDTNLAVVLPGHPAAGDEGAIDDAVADCPARALRAVRG